MKYVDIYSYDLAGYQKLFNFQSWRMAVLNYIDELEIENIVYVEAHNDTDEAFVLLEGSCRLIFACVKDGRITTFESEKLEKNRIYKIPKGVFHTHTLSKDAKLLIVEEEATSEFNSPRVYFNETEKDLFMKTFKEGHHV